MRSGAASWATPSSSPSSATAWPAAWATPTLLSCWRSGAVTSSVTLPHAGGSMGHSTGLVYWPADVAHRVEFVLAASLSCCAVRSRLQPDDVVGARVERPGCWPAAGAEPSTAVRRACAACRPAAHLLALRLVRPPLAWHMSPRVCGALCVRTALARLWGEQHSGLTRQGPTPRGSQVLERSHPPVPQARGETRPGRTPAQVAVPGKGHQLHAMLPSDAGGPAIRPVLRQQRPGACRARRLQQHGRVEGGGDADAAGAAQCVAQSLVFCFSAQHRN